MQTTDAFVRSRGQDLAELPSDQHRQNLTEAEQAEPARCEKVGVRGWRAFVEVGQALK